MKKILMLTGFFLLITISFCKAEDTQFKVFKVKYGNAQSLYKIINDLKSEKGKVTYDAHSNSVIIVDTPQNIARISALIEGLDVKAKQVEIKVSVVEASAELFRDIGVSTGGIIIPSGKFSAIFNAIERDKNANVKTSIMVRTQSNQPAQIQVSSDEFIGNEVIIYDNGTVVTSPLREPVGSFLEVLPVVNDSTITVTVRPSVSTLGKNASIHEQTILANAVINDGETIVIGGLDSKRQVDKTSRTLLDVPLSSKAKSETKKVVMFLTAKIVE